MKFDPKSPPRAFDAAGRTLQDCGAMALEPGEQVTFTTPAGGECDFARTDWGFYATPSLNGRLAGFGLRGALVRNADGKNFVVLVEEGRTAAFEAYLDEQKMQIVRWLDGDLTDLGEGN